MADFDILKKKEIKTLFMTLTKSNWKCIQLWALFLKRKSANSSSMPFFKFIEINFKILNFKTTKKEITKTRVILWLLFQEIYL